ncbi:MAG: AGE family epimerase/isomerase [Bacteroidota bacterium]
MRQAPRFLFLLCVLLCIACTAEPASSPTDTQQASGYPISPEKLAGLADAIANQEQTLLATWYPLVVDPVNGGYHSNFDADWQLMQDQPKMIVTQARHVWTASQAFMRYPADSLYLGVARHGYNFLRDHMWDAQHGGFYTLVDQQGNAILNGHNGYKRAYGNAFGIYALSAFAKASGDPEVLDFAKRAFQWLDQHSYDTVYGGYYQFMTRAGKASHKGYAGTPPKDQNSSIHLLEAFTALYDVWPDPTVRARLEEMLVLIRDTMVLDNKYLQLFFDKEWHPVSYRDSSDATRKANLYFDHVSVGHDVETAFLMQEAAHALGIPDESTMLVGKSMVDHALEVGWDDALGGFYDYVYYLKDSTKATVLGDTKNWWAQAEGLNALLLMHTLYPDDGAAYFDKFAQQWTFINEYLIDHERGGWYSGSIDKEPGRIHSQKSGIWKGNYHTVRALMHTSDMLRTEF